MGKGGVLWGRLEMLAKDSNFVIYRRNRSIYRRQVACVDSLRNESRIFDGARPEHCLCIAGTKHGDLALARSNIRVNGELIRTITSARRRCNGFRTSSLFSISQDRNRQGWTYSLARRVIGSSADNRSCSDLRSPRSSRTARREQLGRFARTKTFQTSRHNDTCKTARWSWFTENGRMMNLQDFLLSREAWSRGC